MPKYFIKIVFYCSAGDTDVNRHVTKYNLDLNPRTFQRLPDEATTTLCSFQDRRWANYEKFDEALRNLKASKDVNAFKTDAKTIANDQKNESQAILELTNNLKTISPETADKFVEINRLDG